MHGKEKLLADLSAYRAPNVFLKDVNAHFGYRTISVEAESSANRGTRGAFLAERRARKRERILNESNSQGGSISVLGVGAFSCFSFVASLNGVSRVDADKLQPTGVKAQRVASWSGEWMPRKLAAPPFLLAFLFPFSFSDLARRYIVSENTR